MTRKVKRKRLNIKRTLFFLLLIYIIGYFCYYLLNQPIRHISISGNSLVKDSDIIRLANLKDYPSIFKYSNNKIESNIKKNKLIKEVNVSKRLGSVIKIDIEENKLLFYYLNEDKIILSSGNIIKNDFDSVVGIPTLINECDKDILKKFINGFSSLSENIIYEMNSIEYYPYDNLETINNNRFKIYMNDGNTIIVNVNSVSTLNKYNDIYASLDGKKGTINLDSNKLSNLVFIPYEE